MTAAVQALGRSLVFINYFFFSICAVIRKSKTPFQGIISLKGSLKE